jgi:hypothetical protein
MARQSKRTYWVWDEYPSELAAPPQKNDVETVRQIVTSALGDGMEIVILMTLLRGEMRTASAPIFRTPAPHKLA